MDSLAQRLEVPGFADGFTTIMRRARNDPAFFIDRVLMAPPMRQWQREGCREIKARIDAGEKKLRVLIRACHGAGKSWFAAALLLWYFTGHENCRGLTIAPTWPQVEKALWPNVRKLYRGSLMYQIDPNFAIVNLTELFYGDREETDWFIVGASSDKPMNLEGHHSGGKRGKAAASVRICDEAKGISEESFEATEGLLDSPETLDLWISTPSVRLGRFYERDMSDSRCIRMVVDVDRLIADGVPGKLEWRDECREDWGANSPAFLSRCMAQYVESVEQELFPLSWIDKAMAFEWEAPGPPAGGIVTACPVVLGMDVAGSETGDQNALALYCGPDESDRCEVKYLASWNEQDTMLSKGRAREVRDRFVQMLRRPVTLRIDINGLGQGVYDQLGQEGANAEPYRATNKAKHADRFANRKAEDAWALRGLLERGTLRLPKDPELKRQMAGMHYEVLANGKIRVVDPANSPDILDAVLIASAPSRPAVVGIKSLTNTAIPAASTRMPLLSHRIY